LKLLWKVNLFILKIIEDHYNFKERVIKEYVDFKPLLNEQDKELLKRIEK